MNVRFPLKGGFAVKKALLIVNPNSGKKEGRALSNHVMSHLAESFGSVDVRVSSCATDVESWAREARERECDAVFVMGGDGTVGLSLRGLFEGALEGERMPAFGLIPGGTGNGLARTLGIVPDALRAVESYDFSRTVPFDIGTVNGRPFAYTVTGGTLPEGIREVSPELKSRYGFLAYVASTILRMGNDEHHALRIVVDGKEWEEDFSSFSAFSANALVNEFALHQTSVSDGEIHLIALRNASLPSLLSILPDIVTRAIDGDDQVLFVHGKTIEVSCVDGDLRCGVDGDDGPCLPVKLGVRPGALRMFALKGDL